MLDSNGVYLDKMTDPVMRGISELKIDEHNGIYFVGSNSTIFKLELNGE